MKDQMLLQVTQVIDDSTGIWGVGEIEFGISGMLDPYLMEYGEKGRDEILDTLEYLKRVVIEKYNTILSHANSHPEK